MKTTRIICINRLPYAVVPEDMTDEAAVGMVAAQFFEAMKGETRSGCRVLHANEVLRQPDGIARYFAEDAVVTIMRVGTLPLG